MPKATKKKKAPKIKPAEPLNTFANAFDGARSRHKVGRTAEANQARYLAFAEAYLTNGHNASAAAVAAGCTGSNMGNAGWKLLQKAEVQALIGARAKEIAELAGMTSATWAAELRAVAFSRIGNVVDAFGHLVAVADMPEHVQAGVSSIKVGVAGVVELKFWDKVSALGIMARHLGLFEKDNSQVNDIRVRVELVGD